MPPTDKIPNELLDLVFLDLAQALPSNRLDRIKSHTKFTPKHHLLAVSLVSRKWRACSLRHLFQDMHARLCPEPPTDAGVPEAFLHSIQKQKNVHSLTEFLCTHPEIGRCVRRLSLEGQSRCPSDIRRFWKRWGSFISTARRPDADILVSILNVLPFLQQLYLADILFISPTRTRIARTIDTVQLYRSDYYTDNVLNNLFIFSGITNLRVVTLGHRIDSFSVPDGAILAFGTESLCVRGEFPWLPFSAALQHSGWSTSLKEITIGCSLNPGTIRDMQDFVKAFSPHIVSLQYELAVYDYHGMLSFAREYVQLLDGGLPWTQLQKVTLRFPTYDISRRHNSCFWSSLGTIVACLTPCPALRSVILEMTDNAYAAELREAMVTTALTEIGRTVGGFRRAVTLLIGVGCGCQPLTAEHYEVFQAAMPDLHDAGRLRF